MKFIEYQIEGCWGGDGLSPAAIGSRFLATLDQLEPVSPVMSNWRLLDRVTHKVVPLGDARANLAPFVERNVSRGDFGESLPMDGYGLIVRGAEIVTEEGTPRTVDIALTAGSSWSNNLSFEIGGPFGPKDFSVITYPLYKRVLEIMAAIWPCPWLLARIASGGDAPLPAGTSDDDRTPCDSAWIAYLSRPVAAGLIPPTALNCETTPGGGMILSAVQTLLVQSDADHMRRSRMLEAIMIDRVGLNDVPVTRLPCRSGPY